MKKIILYVLCIITVIVSSAVFGTAEDWRASVSALRDEIIACNLQLSGASSQDEWVEEYLPLSVGSGAEWYVLALNGRNGSDYTACRNTLKEKMDSTAAKVTRQKYALAWLAAGGDIQEASSVLAQTIGKQGLMSWIYGLHLMNNGAEAEGQTAKEVVEYLLDKQFADGGWALMGAASDTDVTAMALQALAPYYHRDDRVKKAVDKAIVRLSEMQDADGGYKGFGKPNPESAAQVWIALSSLGIDALQDARFMKSGSTLLEAIAAYKLEDGSYAHAFGGASNVMATVQALMAYTAYLEMLDGNDGIYLIEKNEAGKPAVIWGYKQIGTITVAMSVLAVIAVLLVLKKKSFKNYAAAVVAAALIIGVIWTVDIQKPDDYYVATMSEDKKITGTVTLEILCDTIKDSGEKHVPSNGVILEKTKFEISENETVYDVLLKAAKKHKIHLQSSGARGMVYLLGIGNISEYDFGDLSGWIYFVNGESYAESCDGYILTDGDEVVWRYTCELGNDLK